MPKAKVCPGCKTPLEGSARQKCGKCKQTFCTCCYCGYYSLCRKCTAIKHFWETYGREIPKGARVFFRSLEPRVIDAMGRSFPPTMEFFFFVDMEPEANWAHSCVYSFVTVFWEKASSYWCGSEWPPRDTTGFEEIRRPK